MELSDRNQHYVGESYIMRGHMVCTLYHIYCIINISYEDEVGGGR